jgi:uracil-DNA glycosylase family 4
MECPLYDTKRVKFMGDTKDVSIVFVMESPDLFESKMGSLLIGSPGDIFWAEITRAGLGNYKAFVATAAMCHIPKEDLKIKEINTVLNNCRSHLERVIKALKPKVIVTMGALAAQQLIKMKTLGDKRGTFIWSEEFNCYVFPTYDPYFCTKKPSAANLFAADLRRVKTFLTEGETVIEDTEIIVERRESIADIINSSKVIAVDTETQGLDYINPNGVMVSYSISNDRRRAYQVFLHEECKELEADFAINWERGKGKARKWTKVFVRRCTNFDTKVRELGRILADENIKKVFMNVKYDLHHIMALFRNNGYSKPEIKGSVIDVRDIAHLIAEGLYARSTLEFLRKSFTTLNTQYSDEFDDAFDKSDMLAIPQDKLTKYAASDACVTYNIALGVTRALKQEPNYEKQLFYYQNMVEPVTNRALYEMEENGITTNMALLPSVKEDLLKELDYLYIKILAAIPHCIKDRYVDKRTPEAPLTKTNMIRDMLYTKEGFNIKPLIDKKTKKPNMSIEKKTRTLLLSTKLSDKAVDFIASYDKWKMIDTLLSRYIKGIEKATRLDGKIHSSFSLSVAATGRSACLVGDTLIYVLDDREKVKIKDIKNGDWVWSFGEDTQPVPTQVKWQGKTGENRKVIKVKYQTQGRRETKEIICTPEHLFMLRDGSYVQAESLHYGDRLMSIERGVTKGYRRMWFTGREGEIREHQQVFLSRKGVLSDQGHHIHHINHNSLDNRPENLLYTASGKEHCSYHPFSEERCKQAGDILKRLYAEGKINRVYKSGEEHPAWKSLDRDWCIRILWENSGKPTAFRDIYHMDYEGVMKKLKLLGVDFKEIARHFDGDGDLITEDRIAEAKLCKNIGDAAKLLKVNYYKAKEFISSDNNHMVLSVECLEQTEEVYDLTIDGPPNFIANGICVHNSQNPNLQNIPKRGPLAKVIRKLFVASPGYSFVSADASQAEIRWAAFLAQEQNMIDIYRAGGDIHASTAEAVLGKPRSEMTEEEFKSARQKGKAIVFGFLYSAGALTFQRVAKTDYGVDLTERQAQEFREGFFNAYPSIKDYHQKVKAECNRDNGVISPLGRFRHLPEMALDTWANSKNKEIQSIIRSAERQALNHAIQSVSSDTVLLSCLEIMKVVDPIECRPVLFIHDELTFEVLTSKIDKYAPIIKYHMINPPLKQFGIELNLPLGSDCKVGTSLDNMYDWKEPELQSIATGENNETP